MMATSSWKAAEGVLDGAIWSEIAEGVEVNEAAWNEDARAVLTPEAVALIADLHRRLHRERHRLLLSRHRRQEAYDLGGLPDYSTDEISEAAQGDWTVAPLPKDLLLRRVEITGPVNDPKMVINMLSRTSDGTMSDAAMLDFEDSMKPSWANVMSGVVNVKGAAEGTLAFSQPAKGDRPAKHYAVDPSDMPLLMVRCRGLHLDESNLRVDGSPVPGGLLDLVLSAFHSAQTLVEQGKTPKYYIPKVEHHLEARWWSELLHGIERGLSLATGTLRVTFLIETLPAAFQMEEILWEAREHAAGLNVGRWDKIFSDIKVLKSHRGRIMPDRATISLNRPWMRNYAERLIAICHRHGAFAMGGMAAFTPGRSETLRAEQTQKVLEDKKLEASMGHDGCWVSHPYFIGPALSAFTNENQLGVLPFIDDQADLLPRGGGPCTLGGLRTNIRVGIAYMRGWRRDIGCVAWDNLMEDLATLEISRAQTWQWLHHEVHLDEGAVVALPLVERVFDEEHQKIADELRAEMTDADPAVVELALEELAQARAQAQSLFTEERFRSFLTCRSELVVKETV